MSKDLSIEGAQDQLPPGLVPSEFPLVHEYYTPTVVAEAVAVLVCPLLPELGGYDGIGGQPLPRDLRPLHPVRSTPATDPVRCLEQEANGSTCHE
jgi:hypothetical protein